MMRARLVLILLTGLVGGVSSLAQTTNGLITGRIYDPTGAVVEGVHVNVTNQSTGTVRTATTSDEGIYLMPQVPPSVYKIEVQKQGFATETQSNIRVEVNQSITLDFKLAVASSAETVTVTGIAPLLNTTSATLSQVVDHATTVDLPLNGREFTQLALLAPGVAPQADSQQGSSFVVALGAGGISPSVNGQRGEQNNFTMDGVLNNSIFTNVWAIAPPPDAIQEFDVQSHITDAQFAITSGANINVVTRSGTNSFHGAVWEFLRNDVLDAQTFPQVARLPYRQNQYGLYFGGPVIIPHVVNGKDNTWFSLYWEGFRFAQSTTALASTVTPKMLSGDFSGVLGAQVGIDSLGRPEYANEIYDPTTSRPDPAHPGEFLRDPFPGNIIPTNQINPASVIVLSKYYPSPNLPVAEGVLPNYQFNSRTTIASDVFGLRIDHQFSEKDTVFARFNRTNGHSNTPQSLPSVVLEVGTYAQEAAIGYSHIFNPKTLVSFRYGYTYTNNIRGYAPAGAAFANSINFSEALPPHFGIQLGPAINIANGYGSVADLHNNFGPEEGMDYHLDLTKTIGHHTFSAGGMYYHIFTRNDNFSATLNFAQNATSQDGTGSPTGYGPASFLLGVVDQYTPSLGNTAVTQLVNWYGIYAQDAWQVSPKLVITAGLRWDYVSPPFYHKIISGLNLLTGQFVITGAVPPLFPQATGSEGYFRPQYDGYEPRLGFAYRATARTVLHGAFAMLDDHNNTLVQENQNLRLSWPTALQPNLTSLDLGIPTTYINNLPAPQSLLSASTPYASAGADPNNKIPYSMEYNLGVQEQLSSSMALKLDYVGSMSRHQFIEPNGNQALYAGPGTVLSREPFPQYGGPFSFSWNDGSGSYNGLQTNVEKSLSSGLFFVASYTWSKSMDIESDPYAGTIVNFYNIGSEWGPSTYSIKHIAVLSGVYELPFGKGKKLLKNADWLVEAVAGGWSVGSIVSLHSGVPFNTILGADVANTGGGAQRAQLTGVNPYSNSQTVSAWLNPAAFAKPASYTYGNEKRDDLFGPAYRDVDLDLAKNFPLWEAATLQFRSEFYNLLNDTNYANPINTVTSSSFGKLTSATNPGREVQFALKLLF